MIKKMVIGGLLLVLAATSLFAGGRREAVNTNNSAKAAETRAQILEKIDALEKANYTGTIAVTNRRSPELTVNNTVYRLMVFPMHELFDLQIKEGDTVTVEAAKITQEVIDQFGGSTGGMPGRMGRGMWNQNDNFATGNYLLVTKMTVNGQTYDLKESLNEDQDGMGYGRMGGRGNRGGALCW